MKLTAIFLLIMTSAFAKTVRYKCEAVRGHKSTRLKVVLKGRAISKIKFAGETFANPYFTQGGLIKAALKKNFNTYTVSFSTPAFKKGDSSILVDFEEFYGLQFNGPIIQPKVDHYTCYLK